MEIYRMELSEETKVLPYQVKVGEACAPTGLIVPRLSFENGKKVFIYSIDGYMPVFKTRISKGDVIETENKLDEIKRGLQDTLLDSEKVLFSEETVFRDSHGNLAFLYYPAEPVPCELNSGVLPELDQVYRQEFDTTKGIKDITIHVGFSIGAYCVFALLNNVISGAAIVSVGLYAVLCILYYFWPRIKENLICTEGIVEQDQQIPSPVYFARDSIEISQEDIESVSVCAKLTSIFDENVEYDILGSSFLIGRNANLVHLYIQDPQVNPVHAEILCESDEFYIRDRCSRNGTYVNYTKIEPETRVPLYGNEQIRVGNETFLFKIR